MPNLTITVDEDVLRRARIRALEQGTSVNALLREYLSSFVGDHPGGQGVRAFIARARSADAGSGGARWTRDEIHDRASLH